MILFVDACLWLQHQSTVVIGCVSRLHGGGGRIRYEVGRSSRWLVVDDAAFSSRSTREDVNLSHELSLNIPN